MSAADTGERLLGYSVEERDGSLVVTLEGSLAAEALRSLRSKLDADGISLASLVTPLFPFRRLASPRASLASPAGAHPSPAALLSPSEAERLTTQKVEQTLADFQEQLAEFRDAFEALQTKLDAERS
jgi:hypothetical protein